MNSSSLQLRKALVADMFRALHAGAWTGLAISRRLAEMGKHVDSSIELLEHFARGGFVFEYSVTMALDDACLAAARTGAPRVRFA